MATNQITLEGREFKFERIWAMPSRHTFTIKPIKQLIQKYSIRPWVDPFCGQSKIAAFRNDLNPECGNSHMDAEEFINTLDEIPGLLFDPPYSPRQMSECYKSIGMKVGMKETQNATLYSRVKNAAAPKVVLNGYVICCGWNSAGMGINRGFELVEILLVPHGAAHNDTIVTVEVRR